MSIVERLLNWKDQTIGMDIPQDAEDVQRLMSEAAEEIERLAEDLKAARQDYQIAQEELVELNYGISAERAR